MVTHHDADHLNMTGKLAAFIREEKVSREDPTSKIEIMMVGDGQRNSQMALC